MVSRNLTRRFILTAAVALACGAGLRAASAAPQVTGAELFAGNPLYEEPKDRAGVGQGLLQDPPLNWRTVLFVGDKLVTCVGQEIWYADLAETKPTIKRLAGKEDLKGQSLKPGPGSDARFANIFGLATLPDGSLVGADQTGNCIFTVEDPFGTAKVSLIAGTTTPQESISPGNPPNVGDVDGPGSKAKFGLPMWPATIGDTIYFIDEGHNKLKQVGSDAAHTVKTVTKMPDGVWYALIALNGKLYAQGNNSSSEAFICEIDPATGATRDVVKGRSDAFESNGAINVSGLTTDGKNLFTSSSGQLLSVTLDGQVKSLAGTGDWFDYRQPYEPAKPQKADKVQLVTARRITTSGSNVFLGYHDNAVYFSARNEGCYIEKLSLK